MHSLSLRYLLLKLYFPTAFLIAIVLAILDATMPPALAQVRTATVTVYVTVVHTVPVYVPVTAYVTVASVATSFITLTNTAVSLGTVTLWNTVSLWNTVTTAAGGILGPMPASIFGQYSDLAIMGGGASVGAAVALASAKLIQARVRDIKPDVGSGDEDKLFADLDSIAKAKDLGKLDEAQKDLSKLKTDEAKLNQDKSRLKVQDLNKALRPLEDGLGVWESFKHEMDKFIHHRKELDEPIRRRKPFP